MAIETNAQFRHALLRVAAPLWLAAIFAAATGRDLLASCLPAAAFSLAALLTRIFPRRFEQFSWLALACWLAALAMLAIGEGDQTFAPALLLLPPFVLTAASLVGPAVGSVAFVAAGGLLLGYVASHPAADIGDFAVRVNDGIALVTR